MHLAPSGAQKLAIGEVPMLGLFKSSYFPRAFIALAGDPSAGAYMESINKS